MFALAAPFVWPRAPAKTEEEEEGRFYYFQFISGGRKSTRAKRAGGDINLAARWLRIWRGKICASSAGKSWGQFGASISGQADLGHFRQA